jgi:hypothetical protein
VSLALYPPHASSRSREVTVIEGVYFNNSAGNRLYTRLALPAMIARFWSGLSAAEPSM